MSTSTMRIATIRFSFALATILLAACHDATRPGGSSSLRFSGSVNSTDTISASLKQALIVEVHDSSGAAAPAGTVVRFTASYTSSKGPEVFVAPLTSQTYLGFTTSTTDARGQASVLIQLGRIAGTAHLVVNVPTLGLEDTALFTVKPGNAYRVVVTPSDTLLYVGKSFTASGSVVDRWGNARTDPVTWNTSGPGLTVTGNGVVTATAVGRFYVRTSGAWGTDSGAVSVVPQGQLAAFSGTYGSFTISSLEVDGSNVRTLATGSDGGIGAHPAWIPGTNSVVYTTVVGSYQTLYTVGPDGVVKSFFTTPPQNVTHQAEPAPTADGSWLYFTAYDSRCSAYAYCVSRAKLDGSSEELVIPTPSRSPSPSPDGSKVAYRVADGSTIKVFDVATATASSWSVSGSWPAWSPDGTQIAYRDATGRISFVAPDGTGGRTLAPATTVEAIRGWSPDGKWLLVSNYGVPALVNAADGSQMPLRYVAGKVPASMK